MGEMRQFQLEDNTIGPVLRAKDEELKPPETVTSHYSIETHRLFQMWEQLVVESGVLIRLFQSPTGKEPPTKQLVAPKSLRDVILSQLHSSITGGHLGEAKTLTKLKRSFYWPGHYKDVESWCRTCSQCATRKSPNPHQKGPLQSITMGAPMQLVAVDLLGPLPTSETGNKYILVAMDYFTKWAEAYPVPNMEAITVARTLTNEMFFRFSPPERLHSDQGKQFESNLVKEVCRILQIEKCRTLPYHPQCDGLVERFNRTLLHMLATSSKSNPINWEDYVRPVCFAYNTSIQSTTGYTPHFLMFGLEARLPVDLLFGTAFSDTTSSDQYVRALQNKLAYAYQLVREKLGDVQQKQQVLYNRSLHGKPFLVGDTVWLHSSVVPADGHRKLHHPWTGPFTVLEKISDLNYKIRLLNVKTAKPLIVHFNRLKLCAPDTRFHSPSLLPTSSPPYHVGERAEMVEDDDNALPTTAPAPLVPRRYPTRIRRPPERLREYTII